MYKHILKKAENYVTELFEKNSNETLVFHNLKHTQDVVNRTEEIAGNYNLTEKEMLIIITAAWFHDAGHLFVEPGKHEQMSAELMKSFLLEQTNDKVLIKEIEQCILATKFPTHPKNLLEQIICDADTYHLGTKDFKHTNQQVYEEEKLKKGILDKAEFNKSALKILHSHKYYTEYCKHLLTKGKMKNIQKIKKSLPNE